MEKHETLHDDLGRLQATAILAADKRLGTPTGAWYIDSITMELGRGVYRWDTLAAAVEDLSSAGYEVSPAPINLGGDYEVVHQATQAIISATEAAISDKFAIAEQGFIRFGTCPKSGKSRNNRDNCDECGVSVFEAQFAGASYRVKVDALLEPTYQILKHRPAFRVYGDVVGTGADGEPVLKIKKVVKL